ncbi:MAG: type II toxin-antitoxin system PemK/MazF family toxin [Verrucomicrobia bacterium]|nr:type II toxin-antitoxin system PemK/MazF family toxin [Verrucomicrobiota bacterium]
MSFAPGEIVLATFPFSSLAGAKRRPCVVLAAGDSPGEFVVAFATSNIARQKLPSALLVEPTHPLWRQTGLKSPSVVRVDKLVTLHTSVISGVIGSLPADLLMELRRKLKALLQIP